MAVKPSDGLGDRLARYRRLTGMSARELSEATGYGLTRGVIANIENGRKPDITVDQLIALATALGVPPVVLALPVDQPWRFVRTTNGVQGAVRTRAFRVTDWFQGMVPEKHYFGDAPNPATLVAENLIRTVREYPQVVHHISRAKRDSKEELHDELISDLERILRTLKQLEADPTIYTMDDEVSEGEDSELIEVKSSGLVNPDADDEPEDRDVAPKLFDGISPERLERENWTYNYSMPQEAFDRFTELIFDDESAREPYDLGLILGNGNNGRQG